ncbi:MAG TPA: carbohydrate ABC transporter permease [Caldilineaceae bacterium]|nr:carbohydrate ABC transporter permease [Caldilineaceae bacterium]
MSVQAPRARLVSQALTHLILLSGSVVMVIPLLWTLSTSLKTLQQIAVWPPEWIPDPIMWRNYIDVFSAAPVALWLRNSLVIVAANVIGSVITCSLVAYGFARMDFPGREPLFLLLLSTLMMPYIVRLIPLFVLYNQLGWINTFLPLVVPPLLGRNPFFIFLLRQFFMGIPQDLSDAARIDGSGEFGIWWRIVMPLSKPALAAVTIFSFQQAWDNFLAPLVYMAGRPDLRPLSVGLYLLRGGAGQLPDTHYMMALSVLMILPMLAIFAFGQSYFVQGVTLSGLKG